MKGILIVVAMAACGAAQSQVFGFTTGGPKCPCQEAPSQGQKVTQVQYSPPPVAYLPPVNQSGCQLVQSERPRLFQRLFGRRCR